MNDYNSIMLYRAKHIVYYCVRVGSALQRIQTKRFKPSASELTFKDGGTYQISVDGPTFITSRNKRIYLIEKNFGQILAGSRTKPAISPELAKALFKREWVKQLVAGMNTKQFDAAMLVYVIMGVMGGTGLGFMIGIFYSGM